MPNCWRSCAACRGGIATWRPLNTRKPSWPSIIIVRFSTRPSSISQVSERARINGSPRVSTPRSSVRSGVVTRAVPVQPIALTRASSALPPIAARARATGSTNGRAAAAGKVEKAAPAKISARRLLEPLPSPYKEEPAPRSGACGVPMTNTYPVLPLRDIVVVPHMIVPLFVGRDKSVAALEAAMAADKEIFLVAQLDPAEDDPDREDLYDIGVTATVLQLLKLPDGTVRVLVEGKLRAQLESIGSKDGYLVADVTMLEGEEGEEELAAASEELSAQIPFAAASPEMAALMRSVVDQFENYAKLNRKLPADTAVQLGEIEDASRLADAGAGNIAIKVSDKQALLVEADPAKRLEMVFAFMEGELGVLQVEKKIKSRVKRQMEKTLREYYLNEQLKAIQRELGNEGEEGDGDEIAELTQKIATLKLSKEARTKATAELKKLKTMAPMSAEATVVRNYLDVLLGLPWGKKSKL